MESVRSIVTHNTRIFCLPFPNIVEADKFVFEVWCFPGGLEGINCLTGSKGETEHKISRS